MAGSGQDDPFLWSCDRLASEFSSQRLSSLLTPGRKLPDLDKLAGRIREQELDGQTLLTYEDELGISGLWEDLDIKKAPHKVSINELIRHLKKHSRKYDEWKAGLNEPSQPTDNVEKEPSSTPQPAINVEKGPSPTAQPTDIVEKSLPPSPGVPNGTMATPLNDTSPSPTDDVRALSEPLSDPLDMVLDTPHSGFPTSDEPPPKKRKIAPMVISSTPVHKQPAFIATEADNLLWTGDSLKKISGTTGYLGPHGLLPSRITNPVFDPLEDNDEREFGWVNRRALLPGRAVQVSQKMKRFLRADLYARSSGSVESEDPALPVFGESDEEEELDAATWAEIEAEERERAEEAQKSSKNGYLTKEKVEEVIQKTIETLKEKWVENKKPQKDRTAWGIWRKAYRENTRHSKIQHEQTWLKNLDKRIDDIKAEIAKTRWNGNDGLEDKAASYLDASVADYMESQWLIDLLRNPVQPPRPSKLPKLKRPPKKTPVDLGEDEEILTDDDFVVDDGYDADPMDLDSNLPEDQSPEPDAAQESKTPVSSQVIKSEDPVFSTPRKVRVISDPISIPSTPVKTLEKLPDVFDIEAVAQIGAEYWTQVSDKERLLVAILFDKSPMWRSKVFDFINEQEPEDLWETKVKPGLSAAHAASLQKKPVEIDPACFDVAKLFNAFVSGTHTRMNKGRHEISCITWQKTKQRGFQFPEFCKLVKAVMPKFLVPRTDGGAGDGAASSEAENLESDSSENMLTISKKKRKKRRDSKARDLRENTRAQAIEFEKRRQLLRDRLAQTGSVPSDKSRLIVNETKESDDQALIYINESIGRKIKDHQIDGVRFLWNIIVVSKARAGGGLLAHAMGLGKTMQVITFLVVIAESARSPDPSVHSQIPRALRESKTLIMSPPGLLENWVDEILSWAPENLLGDLFKLSAEVKEEARPQMIRQWASRGGVMLIGIDLFSKLVTEGGEPSSLILETPSIVVCDEAHILKNPTSLRHKATRNFRTKNRIALTGSPLTKSIDDYYWMMDWIAPGYLADHAEFAQRFEKPIKQGLFADSDEAAKRRARKRLHVLKALVEPKVHRRDTDVLRAELPQKREFILTLPLTDIQKRTYEAYLDALDSPWGTKLSGNTDAWTIVSALTRLVAHPYVFKVHMESNIRKDKALKEGDVKEAIPEKNQSEIMTSLADRRIEDLEKSNKIVVLLKILDECKRVGDKVLLFSQSIDTLNYLSSIFTRQKRIYQRLDGSTKITDRLNAIKKFNSDPDIEVYLISTTAGGVGFNIYGANRVVIFDTKYTPSEEKQAIGRAYRIGQVKPVYVYWLTTGGTYEDAIRNTTVFKSQLASRIVDKKNPDPRSNRLQAFRKRPTIPDRKDVSGVYKLDTVLDAVLKQYADPNDEECIVRDVTRTETFEEEENFQLSPEDQLEAEQDIASERLRITNPEEYKRLEQEKWVKLRAETNPASTPQLGSLPPNTCESTSLQQPQQLFAQAHDTNRLLIKLQVPPHMRDRWPTVTPPPLAQLDGTTGLGPATVASAEGQPRAITTNQNTAPDVLPNIRPVNPPPSAAPISRPVHGSKSLGSLVSPDRVFGSKTQATQATTQSTSTSPKLNFRGIMPPPQGNQGPPEKVSSEGPVTKPLEPILGKHTHYKESPKNTVPIQPVSRVPPPLSVSDEREAQLLTSLTRRAEQLHQKGQKPLLSPRDLMHAINKALNKRQCLGLPRLDKLQNLIKYIQENPRFADGLLSGHLQVRTMIDMDRGRLEQTAMSYRSMSQSEFNTKVWRVQGAPDQSGKENQSSTPKLHTQNGVPEATSTMKGNIREPSQPIKKESRKTTTSRPPPKHNVRPGDTAESPQIID